MTGQELVTLLEIVALAVGISALVTFACLCLSLLRSGISSDDSGDHQGNGHRPPATGCSEGRFPPSAASSVEPPPVQAPSGTTFIVSRTTLRCDTGETQPCEDAFVLKETPGRYWAVRFANLQELVAFVEKHGECVIWIDDEGAGTIEIYDDFRE